MMAHEQSTTPVQARAWRARAGLLFDLFKLRIGLVIGFTAVAGLAVTPGPALAAWRVFTLAAAVTLAAAAAGAFNQFAERDLDARMARTRARPFVVGSLKPGPAWLATIIAMAAAAVLLAALAANAVAALFTLLGAFTYGVVYTLWLKRRTKWNIVIGGLAGSFAVLAGAAAVDPALGPLPLAFALILFLWTPPHFWSLAIAYREDYEAAQIPMLPVLVGEASAARTVLIGSTALVIASLAPSLLGMGWLYLFAALGGGAWLVFTSTRLAMAPGRRQALANFHASLVQLTLLLVAAVADAALHT